MKRGTIAGPLASFVFASRPTVRAPGERLPSKATTSSFTAGPGMDIPSVSASTE